MMGQTFQYAAPLVGALGYNMEDTAVQIGLMANAGIKGEKAGTALRSILSRLSAPPKECADAMEELGVSMTDSNGEMKSLDTVMGELRTAFADLSETEKTATAKHIAGTEAMSGLLAIVNAAPADYDKLKKAVENSSGAAQDMADTMNDNVKGAMTIFKSQVEGVQISLFKKLEPALRNSIKAASNFVSNVDWNGFGDKAKKALDKAIKGLQWIVDHHKGIITALKLVVAAFAI
jgi:TP901 family phage tail tape measure protein